MKNLLFFLLISLATLSCNSGAKGFHSGQTVYINEKCIGAINEDSFDEMTRYCVNRDEQGLEIMDSKGLISILPKGEKGVVTKTAFGKVKIRLESGIEYWCATEFVR